MNTKQICGLIVALSVTVVAAQADSLELKNGSLIKGKFMGGTQANIAFQVGSSVQSYDVADIRSLRFDSEAQGSSPFVPSKQPSAPPAIGQDEVAKSVPSMTIPARARFCPRGFQGAWPPCAACPHPAPSERKILARSESRGSHEPGSSDRPRN